MSGYLIDTCAISEYRKPQPNLGVVTWFARVDLSVLFLSAITVGELRYGIALVKDRAKAAALDAWLTSELLTAFDGRVLPVTAETADRWGQVRARARLSGKPMIVADALIAATALSHNLVLVTRNVDDFADQGVLVANPWS